MVEGEGFEPSYSERTDLQSVAFNHSATPPNRTRDYEAYTYSCQSLETNFLMCNTLAMEIGWVFVKLQVSN
jgi:hypothetical protein